MRRRVPVPKLPVLCSSLVLACSSNPVAATTPDVDVVDGGAVAASSCETTELGDVANDALGQVPGAVIAIDLTTGEEIFAVSNEDLLDASRAPASTVKAFLAHAALEAGVVAPSESLPCNGQWSQGGRTLACFDDHASLDLPKALATSCNAYFYEIVHRLGTDQVAATFEAFGLPGLSTPLREAPQAERMAIAVGHGAGMVTPRQLAAAFARLVTTESPAHEFVHAGMVDAVTAEYGTARQAAVEGMTVAGKTGTADSGDHSHGWFAGYAPADAPAVLVLAYVEGEGTGGSLAAPVAAQVLSTWSKTCREPRATTRAESADAASGNESER